MRLLFTITALLAFPYLFQAREIKGKVLDETGSPVEFVNVVIMKDSTYVDGKTTDAAGMFIFENADSTADMARITMTGYDAITTDIPADGNLSTLTLSPSSVMLGEIVVKANRPLTRVKGNALVTNVENSVLATAGSADDVLKNIPMVTGANGNFSVFGRGDAIIYINGRLVRSSDEVGQLSSGDIKEIQVINNPGAQYGANVNAVIRIVTKKPVGEGFSVSAYTDNIYNKWFTTKEQLNLKYRTGGLEIFGMGYFSHGKNYDDEYAVTTSYGKSLLEMISDQSVSTTQTNITGKIGFNYQFNENHSIGTYYQHDYNRGHHFGHYLNDITENSELSESSVSDLKGWFKALPCNSANIYYNGTVGKFTFDFNGDYMQTKDNDRSYQYEQNKFSDDRNVTTFNTTRNQLFAEKASVSYELPKGNILIGEEYTNSRSRNDFRNPENILNSELTDVRESNMGIFAEISQTFGKFSATAGVRYEHVKSDYYLNDILVDGQSKTYNNLFPSANITYSPGDFKFSLSYSNRISRPTYNNLTGNYFYVNSMLYTRGNPYLKPAKRQDFTAQASWKYITLSAQYTYTKDVITQIYEPYEDNEKINVFTVTNMPDQKLFSIYLNASPVFGIYHPSLSLGMQKQWFGINYRDQYLKLGSPIFTIQMQNTFTLPKDWFIEASFWWRSRGDWKNWSYTHTQSTVNLRVYKMFLDKSLSVYLSVNDIFNGMLYHADIYSGNVKMQSNVNNHGRNVELTIRYNFNTTKSRYKGTGAGLSEKDRF